MLFGTVAIPGSRDLSHLPHIQSPIVVHVFFGRSVLLLLLRNLNFAAFSVVPSQKRTYCPHVATAIGSGVGFLLVWFFAAYPPLVNGLAEKDQSSSCCFLPALPPPQQEKRYRVAGGKAGRYYRELSMGMGNRCAQK